VWEAQAVAYNEKNVVYARVGGLNAGGQMFVSMAGGEAVISVGSIKHINEKREGSMSFALTREAATVLVARLREIYGDKILDKQQPA